MKNEEEIQKIVKELEDNSDDDGVAKMVLELHEDDLKQLKKFYRLVGDRFEKVDKLDHRIKKNRDIAYDSLCSECVRLKGLEE